MLKCSECFWFGFWSSILILILNTHSAITWTQNCGDVCKRQYYDYYCQPQSFKVSWMFKFVGEPLNTALNMAFSHRIFWTSLLWIGASTFSQCNMPNIYNIYKLPPFFCGTVFSPELLNFLGWDAEILTMLARLKSNANGRKGGI